MTRPVHYASRGAELAFPCYRREIVAWLDSPKVESPYMKHMGYTLADYPQLGKLSGVRPRSNTNLRKVTCPRCWDGVYQMAAARLKKAAR